MLKASFKKEYCTLAISSILYFGNLGPKLDVEGEDDPGEPKAVGQIIKYLSVSIMFPGPNISFIRLTEE
jgi:hypothetical protein